MNIINFSKGELSVCRNGSCVNVHVDMTKIIIFGIATLVVVKGIVVLLELSNLQLNVVVL